MIKRNLLVILIIAFITILIGYFAGSNYAKTENLVTIFTTISVKDTPLENSFSTSYDDVQAADHFTETIQGWFKNPIFINKIKTNTSINTISAERQEKQNLFINYSIDDPAIIKKSVDAVKTNLDNEIEKYNRVSGTDFQVSLFDYEASVKQSKTTYLVLFLLLLGLILGISCSYFLEYLRGKIQSASQVENIFQKTVDENLTCRLLNNPKLRYKQVYLENKKFKKINIITIGFASKKLTQILTEQLDNKKTMSISFPIDGTNDMLDSSDFNLLIIKTGVSTLQDVTAIKRILTTDRFALIII